MSSGRVDVKSEPEDHEMSVNGSTGIGINGPPVSNHIIDDPTLLSALLGNDNDNMEIDDQIKTDEVDEIIREIDVYISPELAQSMHLVQFPLQTASHSVNPMFIKNMKDNRQKTIRPPPPPVPTSAKIKAQHSMLELTYNIPKTSFSSQRQVPEVLNLSERTLSSQNIPIKTHMAMGIFDSTGSKIDLVPLKNIMQMRPSFRHVDALFDDETGEEEQQKLDEEKDDKNSSKPIMFKKPENERAMLARRTSYAFKKANEEAEEWTELEVFGPGSEERKAMMKKAYCPRDAREKSLRFMKAGKTGGSDGYVRSLNYLPSAVIDDAIEDFVAGMEVAVSVDGIEGGQPEWMKELVRKVTTMLQGRQGVPISYPVIRSRFHSSISDHALVQALSATATLVRGNFVLKSSLMPLSAPVSNARDTILLLMIKFGFIQRELLIRAYENSGEEAVVITADVINSLLELLARHTLNGMEMKLDDDLTFETEFGAFARLHEIYWEKKEKELENYVHLYETQMNVSKQVVSREHTIL
jgi:DNA-directed RNA polymerase-3 subunit RPC5